ncbi:MAG: hypothetical protein SFY92_03505 [Verrucomicrobiae bacterium]|nr:hypothetical protein [Verrucomicrobiae bacterium]
MLKPLLKWARRLLVAGIILMVLLVASFFGLRLYIKNNLRYLLNSWAANNQIRAEFAYQSLHIGGLRSFTIQDLKIFPAGKPDAPFFTCSNVRVRYHLVDLLLNRKVALVQFEGPFINLTHDLENVVGESATPEQKADRASETPARGWTIGVFRIEEGRIEFSNLGEAIPPINVHYEITIPDLVLGRGNGDGPEPVIATHVSNVTIYSPFDVLSPVLIFKEVEIGLRTDEIIHKKIEFLTFKRPIIYLGEDLFWYVDQAQKLQDSAGASHSKIPWQIKKFNVTEGEVYLNYWGLSGYRLPIEFTCEQEGLVLESFDKLALNVKLRVTPLRELTDFEHYGITIYGLRGEIAFSLPPRKHAQNVVQTVTVDRATWRDFSAEKLWTSVTFDKRGVFLGFGGTCYEGHINAQANIFLQKGVPWDAWLSVSKINTEKLTSDLTADKFTMTGLADFKTSVKARGRSIDTVSGSLIMANPGLMHIYPVDGLTQHLPADWLQIKREALEAFLRGIREYPFDAGRADFNYVGGQNGTLNLSLDGKTGKRDIKFKVEDSIIRNYLR